MRRLSLRAVVALTAPAFLSAPAALAQYDKRERDAPAAIALFSDENFYGDVRDVFDPFSTLRDLSFNDKPRSVAVFAGQWELCEHKNFTGRCVFIKEDVSDLGWFGLNGRITSVRPIYEYTEASHGLMFSRDKYGYIRYADDEIYGYDNWERGYASSWGISSYHFGYSSDYYRYGYYDPTWGYDPYGFAWGPRGTVRYTSTYRRHPRPSVINPYWVGWDWRPSDWRHGHWSWRGNGHDDWRGYRGHRDGWGGHGRGHDDDDDVRPTRDRPGDRWGPGRGGTSVVTTPPPPDPGSGRGSDWRPDDRRSGPGGGPAPIPDPGFTVITPPADPVFEPRPGRGGRGPDVMPDPSGLLGGSDTDGSGDDWRGRGRGGDNGGGGPGRFGGGMSGGGIFGTSGESRPEPDFTPPPPPPRQEVWQGAPEVSRSDEGGGPPRRRGSDEFERGDGDE